MRSPGFVCRNADLDGPDQPHIDLQLKILEEDIHIVESQDPVEIPHPIEEIAVGPDKVSMTYRRSLYELCQAKSGGAGELAVYLKANRDNI